MLEIEKKSCARAREAREAERSEVRNFFFWFKGWGPGGEYGFLNFFVFTKRDSSLVAKKGVLGSILPLELR